MRAEEPKPQPERFKSAMEGGAFCSDRIANRENQVRQVHCEQLTSAGDTSSVQRYVLCGLGREYWVVQTDQISTPS